MRLLPIVLLFACASADKPGTTIADTTGTDPSTTTSTTGTGTTTGSTVIDSCERSIPFSNPDHGEADHYYRDRLLMGLSPVPQDGETLSLELVDGDGTQLSGTTLVLNDGLEFLPDQGLLSETDYTLSVAGCAELSIDFNTGMLGDPVDPSVVVGQGYTLDLVAANWVEPPGVGGLIPSFGFEQLLVGPLDADATYLDLEGAMAIPGTSDQDICVESVTFPAADFTANPYFNVGPADFTVSANGVTVDMFDSSLRGDFSPDGSQILNGELEGVLDVGTLGSLIGVDVCLLLGALSVNCVSCPTGTSNDCIFVRVEDISASGGLPPVQVITQADIDLDPACAYYSTTGTTSP